jgi:Pyridoxamine 5'-phosphate oxidase
MSYPVALVKIFLAALKPVQDGQVMPRAELLAEDAVFTALIRLTGRDAVIARMTGEGTGRVYREASWSEPEPDGDAIKVVGKMPAGSETGGAILVFEVQGDRITIIRHQPLPGAPMPATGMRLTPALKALVNNALATRHPMIVSYVDETGQPVVSFRGSTQAFSDDQLAIWVRNAEGNFIASIRKNPKLALMYRDEDTKETFQFQGRARIATSDEDRRKIYDQAAEVERNHDYARTGLALIIDLDLIEGWFGLTPDGPIDRVRMMRGAGEPA